MYVGKSAGFSFLDLFHLDPCFFITPTVPVAMARKMAKNYLIDGPMQRLHHETEQMKKVLHPSSLCQRVEDYSKMKKLDPAPFTMEEYESVLEQFHFLDVNNNGKLTKQEFTHPLGYLPPFSCSRLRVRWGIK